jgi:hypothetical protein
MKLFDILKSRWPEALMLIVFQACCMVAAKDLQFDPGKPLPSFGRLFILGIGFVAFVIVSQMLFFGFLRTVAMGGTQSAEPMALLRTGREYFWRLLIFQLFLFAAFIFIALEILITVGLMTHQKIAINSIPGWLNILSQAGASLILVKLTYFIPAIVLVRNCGAWESLHWLREIRLFKMGWFWAMVLGIFGIAAGVEYASGFVGQEQILYYPVLAVQAVLSASGMLVLFLAAVLEVVRQTPKSIPDEPIESRMNES